VIEVLAIVLAAIATFAVLFSVSFGVWVSARAAWHDRAAKRRRGGYLDLSSPDGRERIGLRARRRKARGL